MRDPSELRWVQKRFPITQPAEELIVRQYDDVRWLFLDGEAFGVDDDQDTGYRDGDAGGLGKEGGGAGCLESGIADVGMLLPCDHQGATSYPDGLPGMVLGIDGENAIRTNYDMVNIGGS